MESRSPGWMLGHPAARGVDGGGQVDEVAVRLPDPAGADDPGRDEVLAGGERRVERGVLSRMSGHQDSGTGGCPQPAGSVLVAVWVGTTRVPVSPTALMTGHCGDSPLPV